MPEVLWQLFQVQTTVQLPDGKIFNKDNEQPYRGESA
jgi:hypothetical protein